MWVGSVDTPRTSPHPSHVSARAGYYWLLQLRIVCSAATLTRPSDQPRSPHGSRYSPLPSYPPQTEAHLFDSSDRHPDAVTGRRGCGYIQCRVRHPEHEQDKRTPPIPPTPRADSPQYDTDPPQSSHRTRLTETDHHLQRCPRLSCVNPPGPVPGSDVRGRVRR